MQWNFKKFDDFSYCRYNVGSLREIWIFLFFFEKTLKDVDDFVMLSGRFWFTRMLVCVYVRMRVCMYACMSVCMYCVCIDLFCVYRFVCVVLCCLAGHRAKDFRRRYTFYNLCPACQKPLLYHSVCNNNNTTTHTNTYTDVDIHTWNTRTYISSSFQ